MGVGERGHEVGNGKSDRRRFVSDFRRVDFTKGHR